MEVQYTQHPAPPRLSASVLASPIIRYGAALVGVGFATLFRLFLSRYLGSTAVPFITYFPIVVLSAWFGGFGPGLLSAVLGAILADYFFVPPTHAFTWPAPSDLWLLGTFLLVSLAIAIMGEAQRKAQQRVLASQKLIATTLKSIGDAVIATDPEGHITFLNPIAETMTGWTQQEAAGKPLPEVFRICNETTREPVESPVTKVLREGVVVGLANHTVLIAKDGTERPIDDSGAPIRDEAGNLLGVILVFHDITERKYAEEALRERESSFRLLFADNPHPMWVYDLKTLAFLEVNDTAIVQYGYTHEEFLQMRITDIRPEAEVARLLQDVSAERPAIQHSGIWKHRRKNGQVIEVEIISHTLDFMGGRAVLVISHDVTERKQAQSALQESEEQFRALFEQAAVGIAQVGSDYRWMRVNQKLCDILGYTREEFLELKFEDITHPDDQGADQSAALRLLSGEIPHYSHVMRNLHKDGSVVWVHLTVSLVRQPSGEPKYFICVIEDITERKRLENQLLQAQKLESVGRLAGGVAHDFNNLLTVILGYTELLEEEALEDAPRKHLQNISHAAEKASNLTGQLLAFARRQVIEPKVLNLNELILSLDKILRRLIGEDIELVMLPTDDLHAVKVDPGQFEQILINLVINARDAMPEGGKITIETHNATLDTDYARQHEEVTPGEYVVLAVSDTGTGMHEEIRLHIFEPFFTTKEQGRGTGLGLATVYGIVKQAGGHIWLYSEVGTGTTFKIYLPRVATPIEAIVAARPPSALEGGAETILLVEDEPSVRSLAAQTLRGQGYTVLEAMHGEEALRVANGTKHTIALLLTDVVMPQMSGSELAARLQTLYPELKVLYASGYTENTIVHHGVLEPGIAFLSKPFTPTQLMRKVRETLDSAQTADQAPVRSV